METNISTVQVVLMGLITVFVVLICLIVIIKILGLIMEKVAKKQPAPAAAPAAAAPAAAPLRRYPPKTTSRSLPLSQSRSPRRWARTFRTSASIPSKESEMRKARNLTDER